MGPGFPGFQVGLGNKMAAIGSVDDDVVVLVPVGLDSLGGVYEYGYGGGVIVLVTGG